MSTQTAQLVQVVQVIPYSCTRSRFRRWKEQSNNKEMGGPPGPAVPTSYSESSDVIPVECDHAKAGPALDPLYTGTLTGKVPHGWTREGWILAMRDRMSRTNCPDMQRRLREELAAIKPQYLLSAAKTPNNRHARQRKTPADRPLW